MKNAAKILFVLGLFSIAAFAQTGEPTPETAAPPIVPIKNIIKPANNKSAVTGKTYTNETYNFQITLPTGWVIPENYLEENILEHGYDLRAESPEKTQSNISRNIDHVKVLLTAYHSAPGSKEKTIIRVSVEDLSALPDVKDAVDYFDLMRQNFKVMKLPPDFKYSETQAEQVGKRKDFAFLDISSRAGKKRLYATVRNGSALMFTLSYKTDADLQTFRQILAAGNFHLK